MFIGNDDDERKKGMNNITHIYIYVKKEKKRKKRKKRRRRRSGSRVWRYNKRHTISFA